MAVRKRDLADLPGVTGDDFSKLAHAFRDYVLACQDDNDDVFIALVDQIGYDRDDAKWVLGILTDGVGHLYDSATDPRAEQFKKDTTPVRRKRKRG